MENARQLNLWLLVTEHKQKKKKKKNHFTAVDTNLKTQVVDTYLSGHYYKHKPPKHMSTFNIYTEVVTASQLKYFLSNL